MRVLTLWAPALLIGLYFVLVVLLTSDRPIEDDAAIAASVDAARQADSLGAAWSRLWALHNEHRVVTTKLVFLLDASIFGRFDYRALALVGNLYLLLIFALMCNQAKRHDAPPLTVLVLALLLFNYGGAESMLWSMVALSTYAVLAFCVAAFVVLKNAPYGSLLALPLAILAALSQGNGLLVPLLGVAYLVGNRRWASAAVWGLTAGILLAAYFHEYRAPSQHSDPLASLSRAGEAVIYALTFTGSAFGYGGEGRTLMNLVFVPIAALAGAALWAVTAWGFLRQKFRVAEPYLWINLMIIGTAVVTALSRLDFGLQQALVPRYHINSYLILASTLMFLLTLQPSVPIARFVRGKMPSLAAAGALYAVATIPILIWMHRAFAILASSD